MTAKDGGTIGTEGEGGTPQTARILKTTKSGKPHGISRLAKIGLPVPKAKSRGGAPKGNRNAWKTGSHRAELRDLRRRIAAFHRRARAAIAYAEEQIAEMARARGCV